MNYWAYKRMTYDLDKLTLESFKQLTGLKDKDYYELTGKERPNKKAPEPVADEIPEVSNDEEPEKKTVKKK